MNHRFSVTMKHLALLALALTSSSALAADPTPATTAGRTNAAPAAKTAPSSSRPAAAAARTAPPQPAITLSYDAFSVIGDRNVFNQNRSSRRNTQETNAPAPVVDMIGFVGTMDYGKGQMAFFNGTSAEFKKMAKTGDSVGAFKLVSVTPKEVKLSASEKEELALTIGQVLRRENSGPWALSSQPLPDSVTGASSSSSGSSSGFDRGSRGSSDPFAGRTRGGSDNGGGNNGRTRGAFGADATPSIQTTNSGLSPEEALKRLMEKRAKE